MYDYQTHHELLAQAGNDCAERAEIVRMLSARAACTSDACRQGRAACPTPLACQVPDDDALGAWRGLLLALPFALALWLLVVIVGWWLLS